MDLMKIVGEYDKQQPNFTPYRLRNRIILNCLKIYTSSCDNSSYEKGKDFSNTVAMVLYYAKQLEHNTKCWREHTVLWYDLLNQADIDYLIETGYVLESHILYASILKRRPLTEFETEHLLDNSLKYHLDAEYIKTGNYTQYANTFDPEVIDVICSEDVFMKHCDVIAQDEKINERNKELLEDTERLHIDRCEAFELYKEIDEYGEFTGRYES